MYRTELRNIFNEQDFWENTKSLDALIEDAESRLRHWGFALFDVFIDKNAWITVLIDSSSDEAHFKFHSRFSRPDTQFVIQMAQVGKIVRSARKIQKELTNDKRKAANQGT